MFRKKKPRIEQLDKYLADKEYDTALIAVASELKKNPARFNLLLRQAEILGLAGDRNKAITVYRDLAEHYAKDGFFAKSIALYKKVLRLDPSLEEAHAELARLIKEESKTQRPLSERLATIKSASPPKSTPEIENPADDVEAKEREASALFSAFPPAVLEEILGLTSLRTFHQGDIIVTEGEKSTSMFLVVSGQVKVFTREANGGHLPLAELGPGDFFGEVSLLTGRPRTATITAKTEVNTIELSREIVEQIGARHPEVRKVLEDFYESRAQATVEAVIQRMRVK